MDTQYDAAVKSIIGTRGEQQDRAFCRAEGGCVFAAVCDGMGGMSEGHIASGITIEKIKALYDAKNGEEAAPAFFLRVVDILDESVVSLKNGEGGRLEAGTTITAVIIEGNKLFWLSVGDSRLYLLRGGEIAQVTRDHNYFLSLNQMKDGKQIDQAQYDAESRKGGALISFIGMGGVEIMDINEKPFILQQGDTALLTTDGLYKSLPDSEILRLLSGGGAETALNSLIEEATNRAAKFQDNTTCVVIRYR
jgi:protein phosphatase